MRYLFFKTRRNFWTLMCKISAKLAASMPKIALFVSLLDHSITKRSVALSDEATFCMEVISKWQNRARLCVLAHHENEKVLKKEKV